MQGYRFEPSDGPKQPSQHPKVIGRMAGQAKQIELLLAFNDPFEDSRSDPEKEAVLTSAPAPLFQSLATSQEIPPHS